MQSATNIARRAGIGMFCFFLAKGLAWLALAAAVGLGADIL